jgi:hypothetical protein
MFTLPMFSHIMTHVYMANELANENYNVTILVPGEIEQT